MKNYQKIICSIFILGFFTIVFHCKIVDYEEKSEIESVESKISEKSEKNDIAVFLPKSTTASIVKHQGYTLSYSEKYEQAEWVAYKLTQSQLTKINYERPFFIQDPAVKTQSADWRNYKKSGYDKGHLCPAADRKFSKEAFEETFYTSNISPQLHDFNSGIWNRLEQKTRYWAGKYETVYVITGSVLTAGLRTIGSEKVAVPDCFYKVLLREKKGQYHMIGFLVPHAKSSKSLSEFVVSVDEIEKQTGIDFFPQLDDATENRLEQATDYKDWSFN